MKLNEKYVALVDEIIRKMESENLNISKMMNHINPKRSCGELYRGINLLNLMLISDLYPDNSDYWFTFNKAKELGANVKKGSKSMPVFFFSTFGIDENGKRYYGDSMDEDSHKIIKFMKVSPVFNANQIEGLDSKYYTHDSKAVEIDELELFFNNLNLDIRLDNFESPYFHMVDDYISMPDMKKFTKSEYYYSVLAHELVHWTGYKDRLNRDFINAKDKEAYAFEELVAEIGSVFLCSRLGIESRIDDNHINYLKYYIKMLKEDKRLLLKAASKAQEAVDYVFELYESNIGCQPLKKAS